ncbi:MAG: S-layer homology domain-containing protein [Evtepia sp.]
MKKRLLSLALCLALCLGLLPVGVLAEEIVPGEDSNTDYVASVTMSNGETTNYTSLDDALNAAQNGDTVKLLANHTTDWDAVYASEEQMAVVKTRITLDLNGNTVDYLVVGEVVPDEGVGIIDDGNLTVKSSLSGGTAMEGQITTLKFVKGTLSVQDGVVIGSSSSSPSGLICEAGSGTVTISGGMVYNAKVGKGAAVTVSGGLLHQGQWINNGTLNITGGTFGWVKFYNNSGTIAISGGTFGSLQNLDNDSSQIAPMSLLAPGHAFYERYNENTVKDGSSRDFLQDVTVKEHTHTMVINKCACGYTCPHTSVDANGACTVCHKQIAASVTAGEDVTYYDGLGKALNYANQNKGCTLKLLANVESAVSVEAPLIFDLNGHNVQGLSVCAKATIRDSGTEKGKIGKVLIVDKEEEKTNLTLGDLLEEGYGFKHENGIWADDSHKETISGLKVTVEEAPIKSVVLDAIGADNKEVPTTMAYGTTGAVTLEASCWINDMTVPTYTWYKLEGAAATAPMEGVNVVKYKLPADLPAGKHTYLVTCTSGGYSKSAEITITVTPISLECAEVTVQNPTYNGDKQSPTLKVSLGGKTLRENTDYTVVVTPRTDAGSYTLTINGMGNYTGTATSNWKITPKTVTNPTIKLSSGPFTYTGQKIEPTVTVMDEGKTIPASEYTVSYENNTNAGTAKIILKDNDVGNYIVSGGAEFTIDKAQATCTPPTANDLTYNGTAQQLFGPGSTQDGTLVYSMHRYGGYVEYGNFCATSAKNYTIWYKVMGDSNHTISEVNSITVTIKPAPLTVTAKDRSAYVGSAVPTLPTELVENTDYTVTGLFKEDKLTKTPKLSYVATPDMSKVGEFVVNISEADAESNYTITYVPGKLTITTRPSSGGSGNTGTKTDTVKNPDGSTTKTETKADGSKTETTTATTPGGSTGSTVTKTDTKGNSQTEANAKLSDKDVKDAQETGEAVTVPVKDIEAGKDSNSATEIKIDVPKNSGKTTVEIPVDNVTSGTVAVIVHPDGTEELVKDSKPTEGGVQLELSGSTMVKIIDNSKTFDDTKDHWSRDEVNFVAARELFNGVGGNQFGVSQPMTRGMVNTVLARLAGVDTTPGQGQAWYEVGTDWAKKNGISDGTNPTAPVTREQLATLLYRYAGSPSVSGTLHAADAASVSDYAEDALLWANQNGIVNGVGSNTIAPKDNAQRAQVAAMLARYLQNQ